MARCTERPALIRAGALFVALALSAAPGGTAASAARAAAAPPEQAALEAAFARIARRAPGRVGIAVTHVESGRTAGLNANEPRIMQSTFKLGVALAVMGGVDDGAIRLGEPVRVLASDVAPGVSDIGRAHPRGGVAVTVHDLLDHMLATSDNTACDVLVRRAGGPAAITAWLHAHGVPDMDVSRPERVLGNDWYGLVPATPESLWTADSLRAWREAVPAPVRARAAAAFLKDPRDRATPAAFAGALARLQRRELLSGASTDTLLAMLARCRVGGARLRAGLPPQAKLAHRTGTGGTWRGGTNAVNDVGLITLPGGGGHVAIAVLIEDVHGPVARAERTIADVARAVFERWNAPD